MIRLLPMLEPRVLGRASTHNRHSGHHWVDLRARASPSPVPSQGTAPLGQSLGAFALLSNLRVERHQSRPVALAGAPAPAGRKDARVSRVVPVSAVGGRTDDAAG